MTVLRSYATYATLGGLALLSVAYWLLSADSFAEIFRAVALTVMLMLTPIFWGPAKAAYSTPGNPAPENWAGLALFWFCGLTGVGFLFALFYRLSGRPMWLLDLALVNASAVGVVIFGAAFTLAPGFFGKQVDPKSRRWVATLWVCTAAFVIVLLIAKPDLAPVAEWIRQALFAGPSPT